MSDHAFSCPIPYRIALRRPVAWLLLALLSGCGAYLVFGGKPWEPKVAARLASESGGKIQDIVQAWSWYGAAANAVLIVGLLAALPLWMRPLVVAPQTAAKGGRWFWGAVGGAVLLCGVLAAPRLAFSLWDDEEYSLRRAILGSWERGKGGALEFDALSWRETLWNYKKPNNHVLHSLAARASIEVWSAFAKPANRGVNEVALRAPAFVAALLGLVSVAWLLRSMGYPAAGALAAFLLAVQPWYLRYASEARGYALVLALLPLALGLLLRALEEGRWRWWIGFGLAQFTVLWTNPGPLWVLVLANLGAAAAIAVGRCGRERGIFFGRWIVGNLSGAIPAVVAMFPHLPQVKRYLTTPEAIGTMGPPWLKDVGCYLLAGIPWKQPGEPRGDFPEMARFAAATPWLFWAAFALATTAVCAGMARLAARRDPQIIVVLAAFGGPVTYLFAAGKGMFLWEWYMVFMLPFLAVFAGLGADLLVSRAPAAIRAGFLAVFFAGYACLVWPNVAIMRAGSMQPVRESVLLTRPSLDPLDPANAAVITAGFQAMPGWYDPLMRKIGSEAELRALIAEARATGTAMFVNLGNIGLARARMPERLRVVEGPDFELVAELPGFKKIWTRRVYRLVGGSGGDR